MFNEVERETLDVIAQSFDILTRKAGAHVTIKEFNKYCHEFNMGDEVKQAEYTKLVVNPTDRDLHELTLAYSFRKYAIDYEVNKNDRQSK